MSNPQPSYDQVQAVIDLCRADLECRFTIGKVATSLDPDEVREAMRIAINAWAQEDGFVLADIEPGEPVIEGK